MDLKHQKIDTLWINANLATMTQSEHYGQIKDGAIAVSGNKIAWVGKCADIPAYAGSAEICDAGGRWITPGLIDCHTHLVYAGNRANEFEMRLNGASYEEIARHGGGIMATVMATRQADEDTLFRESAPRLTSLLSEGVTTVEIKSGYGLDMNTELRMLKVAKRMGQAFPVTIVPTYLGAHALAPEFKGDPEGYIDFICKLVLPQIVEHRFAQAVDAFCETIGFTVSQVDRIFTAASGYDLCVKIHAEQFSDQGGASLAARFGALSADHLEYLSEHGAEDMAKAGTTAVLLPGAFYCLREKRIPPVAILRKFGIPIAVSTDCNPGSSPVGSILLMLNMASTLFCLTPEESLAGVTINAAKALGIQNQKGSLEAGKDADFVLWDITMPAELAYGIGFNPCAAIIRHGKRVEKKSEGR